MPLYDYMCSECGQFEAISSVSKRTVHKCPSCSREAKQMLSAPSIALDGTDPGFPTAYDKWAKRHEAAGSKI